MHGNSTGVESADPSSADDLVRQRNALTQFNATAKAACDVGEHKLQREAEDAAARCVQRIEAIEREQALQLRRLDGENPEAPREETQVAPWW